MEWKEHKPVSGNAKHLEKMAASYLKKSLVYRYGKLPDASSVIRAGLSKIEEWGEMLFEGMAKVTDDGKIRSSITLGSMVDTMSARLGLCWW